MMFSFEVIRFNRAIRKFVLNTKRIRGFIAVLRVGKI